MRDRRWWVWLVAVSVWACGGSADEAAEPETAAVAVAEGGESVPLDTVAESGGRGTLTAEWTGRQALERIDSAFPHSAHRDVECRRCHVRPASHVTHTESPCTACHRRPAILASLPSLSSRECASCHHEANEERACTSCHETDTVGPRPMLLAVSAADRERVRVHSVSFSHSLHASQSCRRCHTEPVTRDFGGDCSVCHDSHHRAEARCTTCHEAAGLAAHASRDVHQGCGGAGCHQDAAVLQLRPVRNVCLTCHTGMVDHKPGQECRECHAITVDRLGGETGGRR